METMNVSIVILKNGDQIVCDLKEVYEGEGDDRKGICLLMIHPYLLSLIAVENAENPQQDLQVKFSRWCPYSTDTQFKIPYDTVMSIGTCDSNLSMAYINKVNQVNEIQNVVDPEVIENE